MINKIQIFLIALLLLLGCKENLNKRIEEQPKKGKTMKFNEIEKKIIKIARQHVAIKYPNSLNITDTPIITKTNNIWKVTYILPENMIGGTPIIYIDGNNFNVTRSYHGQ